MYENYTEPQSNNNENATYKTCCHNKIFIISNKIMQSHMDITVTLICTKGSNRVQEKEMKIMKKVAGYNEIRFLKKGIINWKSKTKVR